MLITDVSCCVGAEEQPRFLESDKVSVDAEAARHGPASSGAWKEAS